jgi:hypothetical protein
MQSKTCCIIGYLDVPAEKADAVRWELEREIKKALEDGYTVFITEFNESAGVLFAERIDEWREKYPGIFWEVILARLDQAEIFNREKAALFSKCSGIRGLCPKCKGEYPLSVTRYMVGASYRVIAVCAANDDRDTYYAMDYANNMGRDLRTIQLY